MNELRLPASIRRELVEHAQGDAPREACGLFVVIASEVVRYRPMRNAAAELAEHRFELDPAEVLPIVRDDLDELRPGWMHGGVRDPTDFPVFGVFHSHPSGDAWPTRADREAFAALEWAAWPVLIYGGANDELRAWWRVHVVGTSFSIGRLIELPLVDVVDG